MTKDAQLAAENWVSVSARFVWRPGRVVAPGSLGAAAVAGTVVRTCWPRLPWDGKYSEVP